MAGFMLVYGDKNPDSFFQTNKFSTILQKDYISLDIIIQEDER